MSSDLPTVLIVDDKRNMLSLMSKVLRNDARVLTASGAVQATHILEREAVNVVLCDLKMPDGDGVEVLDRCKRLRPKAEFVLMTAYATVPTAVEALRRGAFDYLTKPFAPEVARSVILRALGRAASRTPSDTPPSAMNEVLPGVLACSDSMRELAELVRKIADSDATVLLLGETGTGKERIARAVHTLSPRSSHRFVAVNCAAIPADLIESELFGYSKGSFTGAGRDRAGLFEEANQGTLFLDEIGELGLSLQAKLTRALEERAIRRLGESKERQVDVRLVAATHRNVEAMVNNETFREDLWYRLNVAVIRIPPLRERKDDVELLAEHFLRLQLPAKNTQIVGFTAPALCALREFEWPGNVRQLRAAVERAAVVSSSKRIDVGDLPPEIIRIRDGSNWVDLKWTEAKERGQLDLGATYLEAVLHRYNGDVVQAAQHAGVERESFYRLLRRYGVSPLPKSTSG